MALRSIPSRAPARMVDKILGSDEVQILIGELEQKRPAGRRGYGVRALLGACFVKSLYRFATWRETADLIREHQALQDVLGGAPSEWACYRFLARCSRTGGWSRTASGRSCPHSVSSARSSAGTTTSCEPPPLVLSDHPKLPAQSHP